MPLNVLLTIPFLGPPSQNPLWSTTMKSTLALVSECLPRPKIRMLKSHPPKVVVLEDGAFKIRLNHEARILMKGTSALIKDALENSLGFSTRWEYNEKSEIQTSVLTWPCWRPELRLPASRTVRNTLLLLRSAQSMTFCYSSPEGMEHDSLPQLRASRSLLKCG